MSLSPLFLPAQRLISPAWPHPGQPSFLVACELHCSCWGVTGRRGSVSLSPLSFSSESREWSSLPTHLLCFCPQELLHYLIGTLLLLIASIVAASKSYSQSGLVAGAVRTFPRRRQGGIPILNAHFLPHRAAKGLFFGAFLSRDQSPP